MKRSYPHKSHQSQSGAIGKFTRGLVPDLIKSWTCGQADDFFVTNNHLEKLGSYDVVANRIDLTTQAHTIGTYPIGLIHKELSKTFGKLKEDGVSERKLKNRLEGLQVRAGIYDNRHKTAQDLLTARKEALKEAKRINLDDDFYKFKYNEVYFIYQVMQGDDQEPPQPIVYRWDKVTADFERMEHI